MQTAMKEASVATNQKIKPCPQCGTPLMKPLGQMLSAITAAPIVKPLQTDLFATV